MPDAAFQQLIKIVCKKTAADYILNFLKINEVDEFKRSVYLTLRDMNTVLRNQLAVVATSSDLYTPQKNYEGSTPPRFDKMERMLKDKQRAVSCR